MVLMSMQKEEKEKEVSERKTFFKVDLYVDSLLLQEFLSTARD